MKKNIIKFAIASIAVLSLAACAKTTTTKKITTANITTGNKTTTGSKTTTNKVTTNRVTTNNKTTVNAELAKYIVTETEFTDALSMKGVDAISIKTTEVDGDDVFASIDVLAGQYRLKYKIEDNIIMSTSIHKFSTEDGEKYDNLYLKFAYNNSLYLFGKDIVSELDTPQNVLDFLPEYFASYSDYTFDATSKSYKAETLEIRDEFMIINNVELKFENGKLLYLSYSLENEIYTAEFEYDVTEEDILNKFDGLYDNEALVEQINSAEDKSIIKAYNTVSFTGTYNGENVNKIFEIEGWVNEITPSIKTTTQSDKYMVEGMMEFINAYKLMELSSYSLVSELEDDVIHAYCEFVFSNYGVCYEIELNSLSSSDAPLCVKSVTGYNGITKEKLFELEFSFSNVVIEDL